MFTLYTQKGYILIILMNYQCFCKQRYDQAAQPQNMTLSQRKSCAEKSLDNNDFLFNFHFTMFE